MLVKHHRRSIRLPCWDYSEEGYYFVTICTEKRKCILGEIKEGKMVLNDKGIMVNDWINKLKDKFKSVDLDIYQIMPNHLHLIIIISGRENPAPTLGTIIAYLKYESTKQINSVGARFSRPFPKIWQRNYYEHVIRNNRELAILREYIENNPLEWELDEENPKNIK